MRSVSSCCHPPRSAEQIYLSSPAHLPGAPEEAPRAFSSAGPEGPSETGVEKGQVKAVGAGAGLELLQEDLQRK